MKGYFNFIKIPLTTISTFLDDLKQQSKTPYEDIQQSDAMQFLSLDKSFNNLYR